MVARFDEYPGRGQGTLVFLSGAFTSAGFSVRALLYLLGKRYQRIVAVEYPKRYFQPEQIVSQIIDRYVRPGDPVCVMGASMGGQLAVDVVEEAQLFYPQVPISVFLIHPCIGLQSIKGPGKLFARLAMHTPTKLFWLWNVVTPIMALIMWVATRHPTTDLLSDPTELKQHFHTMGWWPFGTVMRQLRYMGSHQPLDPASVAGIPAVIFRSGANDAVVDACGALEAGQAFGVEPIEVEGAFHADIPEQPDLWGKAINDAWHTLKLQRSSQ